MVNTEGKIFKPRPADRWKMHFSWDFRVLWGVWKKCLIERYIQLSFKHAYKVSKPKSKKKGE